MQTGALVAGLVMLAACAKLASRVAYVNPSGSVAWWREFGGFNLAPVVLDGRHAYVATIGFVGCLDVEAASFTWTHGGLYESNGLNAFDAPVVYEDRVEFPEHDAKKRVVVTRSTGGMVIRSGASA